MRDPFRPDLPGLISLLRGDRGPHLQLLAYAQCIVMATLLILVAQTVIR